MNKQEFLSALAQKLSGLPEQDVKERLAFYEEILDDRMEEGVSESQAVAALGSVDDIFAQIIADTPLPRIVKQRVNGRRSLAGWEITLLILGSPIWLSLLVALVCCIVAVYLVLWAAMAALWAADVCLAFGGAAGVLFSILHFAQANIPGALTLLGGGVACIGLSIFSFYGCLAAIKGLWIVGKKPLFFLKTRLIRKEATV